jgi:predicted phosphoadenosine phosphosulfate sulfurtransferase
MVLQEMAEAWRKLAKEPENQPPGVKRLARHPAWQRACKLILAKEDVLTVSRALELALFMDAKLDVSKSTAKMKAPRGNRG